mgnify:CR=1 FL=1
MTDPRSRLIAVMLIGLLAITLESPEALGLLAAMSSIAMIRAGLDPQWWRRVLGVGAFIVWGTMLSQGLFYAEQPRVAWIQLGPVTIWREGVLWGGVQSLRMLAVTMAGMALAISTPPDRIFSGLIRLRLPYGLAFMAVTALRFVPQVAEEIQTVHRARARRGRPILKRSPMALLRLELMLLSGHRTCSQESTSPCRVSGRARLRSCGSSLRATTALYASLGGYRSRLRSPIGRCSCPLSSSDAALHQRHALLSRAPSPLRWRSRLALITRTGRWMPQHTPQRAGPPGWPGAGP